MKQICTKQYSITSKLYQAQTKVVTVSIDTFILEIFKGTLRLFHQQITLERGVILNFTLTSS